MKCAITLITTKLHVVTQSSSYLSRLIVTAKYSSRRNSNHAVHLDFFFHQNIQNTCRIQSSHGTAFKNKSCFYLFHDLPLFPTLHLKELFYIFAKQGYHTTVHEKHQGNYTFLLLIQKCQRISFGMNKVHKHVCTHNCYIFFL